MTSNTKTTNRILTISSVILFVLLTTVLVTGNYFIIKELKDNNNNLKNKDMVIQILENKIKILEEEKSKNYNATIKSRNLELTYLTKIIESSDMTILFESISEHESGGDELAYNPKEGAAGVAQIRECVIKDLANYGHNYSSSDRYCRDKSFTMFVAYTDIWIQNMELSDTPENRARIWNGGPMGPKKPNTIQYWSSVKNKYNKIKKEREKPEIFELIDFNS